MPRFNNREYRQGLALWNEWENTYDKGNDKFYDNDVFRHIYTMRTVGPFSGVVKLLLKNEFLQDVQNFNGRVRVLSLGCGPCSDLLGFIRSMEYSDVKLHMVGVDERLYSTKKFFDEVDKLELGSEGKYENVQLTTYFAFNTSMEYYARYRRNHKARFQVILLSFINIQNLDTIEFLRYTVIPNLLAYGGSLYVIDNDLPIVSRLQDYDFRYLRKRDTTVAYEYYRNI